MYRNCFSLANLDNEFCLLKRTNHCWSPARVRLLWELLAYRFVTSKKLFAHASAHAIKVARMYSFLRQFRRLTIYDSEFVCVYHSWIVFIMLTLLPLSGLHSALKRRNSKTYDFSRRGSLSVYSTYSLPSSKSSMRRFSSYEELAPIFQIIGKDVQSKTRSLKRKGSAKQSAPSKDVAESTFACDELDAQIARIKGQLVSTFVPSKPLNSL